MKKRSAYHSVISEKLFEKCPKTVFAALTIASLTVGGDYLEEAEERIIHEWWVLFDNGIVPQKPPFPRPKREE